MDGAGVEDKAYRVQLKAKLADIELRAERGDCYLRELGGFESDFRKKDDDDDLGEGDAGGSGGVASSSSMATTSLTMVIMKLRSCWRRRADWRLKRGML